MSKANAQNLAFKYYFPLKETLGKWLNPELGQRNDKMSLEHLTVSESKKVL